jgi:hypothetical protein
LRQEAALLRLFRSGIQESRLVEPVPAGMGGKKRVVEESTIVRLSVGL